MKLHLDAGTLKEAFRRFNEDKVPRLAAALSYTTIFAIAPIFIVLIAIAGAALGLANGGHGHHIVEDDLIGAVQRSAGKEAADTVRMMVTASFKSGQPLLAAIIGWVTLILAAIGLFAALQDALNTVWHVEPPKRGIWLAVRERIASFGVLIAIGFLLVVTTAINTAIAFVSTHLVAVLPFPGAELLFTVVNWILSIAVITVLFALMYKVLPDTEVAWSDVWPGAMVTAVLFVIGQSLIALYLGRAGVGSAYGAAGSLLVLLVWIYYSSMTLLFGAEFTRVYAERHGSRIGGAVPSRPQERTAALPLTNRVRDHFSNG